jgi:hypothetical protein
MPGYVLKTDVIMRCELPASIRCIFSEVIAANGGEVWVRVETRGVKDGVVVDVEVHRVDDAGGPLLEKLDFFAGTVRGGVFEERYRVHLPGEKIDAVQGDIAIVFEARIDAYHLRGRSQALTLARPRFSV